MESVDSHSGYEFPFTPFRLVPFSGSATYHDYHHSSNTGNYSSFFTIWDTLFNENTDYYAHEDQIDQKNRALKADDGKKKE